MMARLPSLFVSHGAPTFAIDPGPMSNPRVYADSSSVRTRSSTRRRTPARYP